MDFSYWLNIEENLLLTATQPGRIQQLIDLSHQSNFHIGIISNDYPLLSHLTLAENVALSSMYHQNLTLTQVRKRIQDAVEALDMASIMDSPPARVTRKETLKAFLLRCVANNNSVVVANRPPHSETEDLLAWLERLPRRMRLWVTCLDKHAPAYMDFTLKKIAIGDARRQGVA